MQDEHITVIYKWTANPGKLDELTTIYSEVTRAMEQNEPDAEAAHCYVSEEEGALYVRDEFKNAAALGFHLGTTAKGHFGQLLSIAVPGSFSFLGEVPDEIKQGIEQMGLKADYGLHTFGFDR